MNGIWVWPNSPREQERILDGIRASETMLVAMAALSKSKAGLSNAEFDATLNVFSQWNTRQVAGQLLSLGFIAYKSEWFGDSGRYSLTELGKNILAQLTGQPALEKAV